MSPLANLIRPVFFVGYQAVRRRASQINCQQKLNHKIADIGARSLHCKTDGINNTSWVGNTKLHEVTKSKSKALKMCQFLLEYGANPNIPDYNGKTPLDTAIANGDKGLCELLIKYGAKTSSL
jgi:ankyrin repeat protein